MFDLRVDPRESAELRSIVLFRSVPRALRRALFFLCLLMPVLHGMGQVPSPSEVREGGPAASRSTEAPESASVVAPPPVSTEPAVDTPRKIMVLDLDGGIFGGTADYLIENIKRAEVEGIPVLLILDTPGGSLESTRDIVKSFMSARVPILVWVGPSGARAGSAGVFITMAANVAAMAPGTNIGAAHPVGVGVGAPGDDEDQAEEGGKKRRSSKDDREIMAQKVENDTLAFIESIATARGRNAEWALTAVKDSASITAEKAKELNVIDLLVKDVPSLLTAVEGKRVETSTGPKILRLENAEQVRVPMTLRQRFLAFLSDPNLVYILFAIGMLGLYLEFNHPGLIFPAVIGGVSLLLALTGLSILPYNATGLLFLLIAGACFVAETYVASFGILALGGAVSLVIAAILLFESPPAIENLPGLQMGVSPVVYGTIALTSLLVVLPIAYLVARAQRRPNAGGREAMVGAVGVVIVPVDAKSGRVFVHGEYWNAVSKTPIAKDTSVKVLSIQGLCLEVTPRDGG